MALSETGQTCPKKHSLIRIQIQSFFAIITFPESQSSLNQKTKSKTRYCYTWNFVYQSRKITSNQPSQKHINSNTYNHISIYKKTIHYPYLSINNQFHIQVYRGK